MRCFEFLELLRLLPEVVADLFMAFVTAAIAVAVTVLNELSDFLIHSLMPVLFSLICVDEKRIQVYTLDIVRDWPWYEHDIGDFLWIYTGIQYTIHIFLSNIFN